MRHLHLSARHGRRNSDLTAVTESRRCGQIVCLITHDGAVGSAREAGGDCTWMATIDLPRGLTPIHLGETNAEATFAARYGAGRR